MAGSYPTANRNLRFFQSELSIPDFRDAFAKEAMDMEEKSLLLLTFIGEEVIAFLRSYTGKVIPLDRRSYEPHPKQEEGMPRPGGWTRTRLMHPGGWGDVTEDLMKKYKYRVEMLDGGWQLNIMNTSDHAVFVEAKEGLFVVRGVMDPGGPVHRALQMAIKKITPGWELQTFNGAIGATQDFAGTYAASAVTSAPEDE